MRKLLLLTTFIATLYGEYKINICSFKLKQNIKNCENIFNRTIKDSNLLVDYDIKEGNGYFFLQVMNLEEKRAFELKEYLDKTKHFSGSYLFYSKDEKSDTIEESKKSSELKDEVKEDSTAAKFKVKIVKTKDLQEQLNLPINKTYNDELQTAKKLFLNKEYQKAYDAFDKLFEKDLNNNEVNFYLGRSAFALKDYDEAINAYERILINNPDNNRVKLEKARALFMAKLFEEAKSVFEEVYNDEKTPIAAKNNIEKYLKFIDDATQRFFLRGVFIASLGYDTNTNSAPADEYINSIVNSTKPQKDSFHQELLVLSAMYDVGKIGGDTFKQDVIIMNKMMSEEYDKNVFFLSLAPKYLMSLENSYSIEYGLNYDMLWYGSERQLDALSFTLGLNKNINKTHIFNINYKYQEKYNKKEADKQKDSYINELSASYRYILNKELNFGIKLLGQNERAHENNITVQSLDVSKDIYSVNLDTNYKFLKTFSFKYIFNYKYTDYIYHNTLVKVDPNAPVREDKIYSNTISLSKMIDNSSMIDLKYNYTRTDSNQANYDTDKSVTTLSYIKSF